MMMTTCAAAVPAHADIAVGGAKRETLASSILPHVIYVIGEYATADEKAPLKLRDYAGSNTLLRSALSYGILRTGGADVTVPKGWGDKHAGMVRSLFAFHHPANLASLEKAFRDQFGKALVKRRSGEGESALISYDVAGLQAAFDALYVKPVQTIGGVPAKLVYDSLFKGFVAQKAEWVAHVLAKRPQLAAAARDYVARSAQPGFDGWAVADAFAKTLPPSGRGEVRLVGTLIRRQADGTLPVLVRMLRTILSDYDPQTFQRLDARLRPGT